MLKSEGRKIKEKKSVLFIKSLEVLNLIKFSHLIFKSDFYDLIFLELN